MRRRAGSSGTAPTRTRRSRPSAGSATQRRERRGRRGGGGPSCRTQATYARARRRFRLFLFDRWIASNSSRDRPEPTATQVRGDSARCAGIWVSWRRRSSRPWRRAPPPPSTMPRALKSEASAGRGRAQALVEALEEGAAAREHDAAAHDVRGELGRRAVEGLLDRVDDLLGRLLERPADLLGRQHDGLRQAGDHVATADLGLHLLLHGEGGADLELDLLGRLLADEQLVLALDVADDRLVELVAADADRLRDDDAAEGDHGDLARAAADVDDHGARGLADGQPGPDRGGHRLLDEVGLARTGREAGLLDGALLDAGDAGGHADDDARVRPAVLVHLLDEVAEHLLRHLEVGDHPVLERPDRGDRARRAAEHPL